MGNFNYVKPLDKTQYNLSPNSSDEDFVILEFVTMGGKGPLQEALLSSDAFEGKNPGENNWNDLIKSRIFKTIGDGQFNHIVFDEDTIVQFVEARVINKK